MTVAEPMRGVTHAPAYRPCCLDAAGPPPAGAAPPLPGTTRFSDLPPDVALRVLALLPANQAKRDLSRVCKGWRDLLAQGGAWPTVDVAPVTAGSAAWLARRAAGLADVSVRPCTEAEAIVFNDVFLAAAPSLASLTLDAPWHTSFSFGYTWWALRCADVASLRLRAQDIDAGALPAGVRALDVECTRVSGGSALARLTRLTSLSLAVWSSGGRRTDGAALLQLTGLRSLALNTHPFDGSLFGKLGALTNLTSLSLSAAPGFAAPLALPPACALHFFTRAAIHPAVGGYVGLVSLELKDVASPRFDASMLASCPALRELDVSFACDAGTVEGLDGLKNLRSLKTGCPALRLALPPLPRLRELEAVAFHDLDIVADRAACAALAGGLRSVYLAALDFGVGVTLFVHEAGRRGLDLRFATRPLRAVFTPNQLAQIDDGSVMVEVV